MAFVIESVIDLNGFGLFGQRTQHLRRMCAGIRTVCVNNTPLVSTRSQPAVVIRLLVVSAFFISFSKPAESLLTGFLISMDKYSMNAIKRKQGGKMEA